MINLPDNQTIHYGSYHYLCSVIIILMKMEKDFIIPYGIFLDANGERHGVKINAYGGMVDIPVEEDMPKWLQESLLEDEDDEEMEVVLVRPFKEDEFKKWLMDKRGISPKSADVYLRAYESAYESLYEKVDIDLYDALQEMLEEIPKLIESDQSKAIAPNFVKIYVETMLEELAENEDAYTAAEKRALTAYHAFIIDMAGTDDKKYIKEKTLPLPDEDEFRSWLETEYKMDSGKIGKIVSSVKRMDIILPSMVSDPMTFLDVLRAIPQRSKQEKYIKLVNRRKRRILKNAGCSKKTIGNGFSNLNFYLNFLNRKNTVNQNF